MNYTEMTYEQLIEELKNKMQALNEYMPKLDAGVAKYMQKCRVDSIEITKLLKAYRKKSLEHERAKQKKRTKQA